MCVRSLRTLLVAGLVGLVGFAGRAPAEEPEVSKAELGRQLVILLGCPGCHTMADPRAYLSPSAMLGASR